MRLGTSSPLSHKSAKEWAENQIKLGCRAVVFPLDCTSPRELIDEYKTAAEENDILIAEVGIWRNPMSLNPDEAKKNTDYCVEQLKLADYLHARCAVNVAGSQGERWDGHYRANFSKEIWNKIVEKTREIIDRAEIENTYFSLEPMPWMYPTGPEEYLKLIEEVNRERFAVHLDGINMINSAERYFNAEEFLDKCFDLLGDKIRSCHVKDVHLKEEYTFQLEECAPGLGEFPILHYVKRINAIDRDMPVILEHLHTDEDYIKYMSYLKELLVGEY